MNELKFINLLVKASTTPGINVQMLVAKKAQILATFSGKLDAEDAFDMIVKHVQQGPSKAKRADISPAITLIPENVDEQNNKKSFWGRYRNYIIAATVAGAITGAAGGAIAGGVISVLSAPVTGGLSLLGAPFLAGVGAGIGFGVGFISGLLTGIARSLYDNHKTKRNPQKLQKEADEFLGDPEELVKPENEITDKNTQSYREIIKISAKGNPKLIDSLKKSQATQSQLSDSKKEIDKNYKLQKSEGSKAFDRGEDSENQIRSIEKQSENSEDGNGFDRGEDSEISDEFNSSQSKI